MNILFLSEQFYPHGSGAELATYLYAKLLSETGFNIRVITNKYPNEGAFSQDEKIHIHRLPLFKLLNNNIGTVRYQILSKISVLFSSFINKMIEWADIVYVPRFWFSAIPLAKTHKKPVITHLHDYIVLCPLIMNFNFSTGAVCKGRNLFCSPKCVYCCEKTKNERTIKGMMTSIFINSISGSLFSHLIAQSDAIVCVSKAQKEAIYKNSSFSPQKLHVVTNPIPTYSDLPLNGFEFGFFGGLDLVKGFSTLYSAASNQLINSGLRQFRIHCTKMAEIKGECSAQLQKKGFSIYGNLEKQKYDEIYRKICAVIVPSIWGEPWPYTVIQALLSGRYLIASKIGGIPDQVKGCKGVSLIDPNNIKQLSESINHVLNLTREEIIDLGSQNRDVFSKRFSNQDSLNSFIAVTENVL